MKKTSTTSFIFCLLAMIMSASCTKKISAPVASSSEKPYTVNVDWQQTENGSTGTFPLPTNTKDAYIVYEGEQVLIRLERPVRYMSCYWLYLLYGTRGEIHCTPIAGEASPIFNISNVKILVR